MGKYKLAIVMRTDLEMGKGKMCVEAGHASILAAWNLLTEEVSNPPDVGGTSHRHAYIFRDWLEEGQFKAVLKVDSLAALEYLSRDAQEAGLPVVRVHDFGFTQVEPNALTCIAIGPAETEKIDAITWSLKLL